MTAMILLAAALAAPAAPAAEPAAPAAAHAISPPPRVHTFSIVARDARTGEMGVAVQSHWFSVGPLVPWAEAGVGAVATQSLVEVSYGPRGLTLMRSGKGAAEALKELVAADEGRDGRQVAMVDSTGQVASWTGPKCIPSAGYSKGDGFSVQANLMANDTIWPAMKTAFEAAQGDLADRMMAALEAAQEAGGDIRGKQSAAMLIVSGERSPDPWRGRLLDLRVEDDPNPLRELKRLIGIQRAYRYADQGDAFLSAGKVPEAMEAYAHASDLQPKNVELLYWKAVGLWNAGRQDEALPVFGQVFKKERLWLELTPRLVPIGLLSADEAGLKRIKKAAPRPPEPHNDGP